MGDWNRSTVRCPRSIVFVSVLHISLLGCGECSDSLSNSIGDPSNNGGVSSSSDDGIERDSGSSGDTGDDAGVGDTADRCRKAAAGTCDDIPGCFEVQASLLDAEGKCADPEPVGCTPDELCTNNIEFAQDEGGDCWMFFSGCFPARFNTEPKVQQSCQMMIADAGCY